MEEVIQMPQNIGAEEAAASETLKMITNLITQFEKECSVCSKHIEHTNSGVCIKCQNIFHSEWLKDCITRAQKCPMWRGDLTIEDVKPSLYYREVLESLITRQTQILNEFNSNLVKWDIHKLETDIYSKKLSKLVCMEWVKESNEAWEIFSFETLHRHIASAITDNLNHTSVALELYKDAFAPLKQIHDYQTNLIQDFGNKIIQEVTNCINQRVSILINSFTQIKDKYGELNQLNTKLSNYKTGTDVMLKEPKSEKQYHSFLKNQDDFIATITNDAFYKLSLANGTWKDSLKACISDESFNILQNNADLKQYTQLNLITEAVKLINSIN